MVGRFFFCCPKFVLWTICGCTVFRPRTKQSDGWFAPTVLLIFQKQFGIHYIRRNSCCPMDSHTDSPAESPKPYRNRNRYLYILYLLCSLSYGCPVDTFLLSLWSSPNYSVKIKIFLLTWCKVVLSYARKKSKGGMQYDLQPY